MGAERARNLIGLVVLSILLGTAGFARAADDRLGEASWHLVTPLGEASGPLVALLGAPGEWRLDLARADGSSDGPADPWRRRGEGWTLCGTAGDGFAWPWHAPWRRLAPELSAAVETLLVVWAGGEWRAPPASGPRRWRADGAEPAANLVWPALDRLLAALADEAPAGASVGTPAGALRRRLVARGHGRGAEELRVRLAWQDGSLACETSRWPGRLILAPVVWRPVAPPAEVYLPLWPLADILP